MKLKNLKLSLFVSKKTLTTLYLAFDAFDRLSGLIARFIERTAAETLSKCTDVLTSNFIGVP